MKSNYKVRFTETQKNVNCEIVVESTEDNVLDEAKELFESAQEYSKLKTLQKNL